MIPTPVVAVAVAPNRPQSQQPQRNRRIIRSFPFIVVLSCSVCSARQRRYRPRVAPSRPIDAPDVDYGGNHPFDPFRVLFETRRVRVGNDKSPWQDMFIRRTNTESKIENASRQHKTTSLHPPTDDLYHPIRIAFDTSRLRSQMELSLSAGDDVAATKLFLLIYEILPSTAQVWEDVLRVIPVVGGIYPLDAVGGSVDVSIPNDGDETAEEECNGKHCREYYEDPVRLLYCPDETTAGIGGGADLLIYATVNRHCEGNSFTATDSSGNGGEGRRTGNDEGHGIFNNGAMGTLASALSCQRDQYDRPITGSIDFCLGGMGDVSSINVAQAIAEKEEASGGGKGGSYYGEASEKWDGWTSTAISRLSGVDDDDSNSSSSFQLDDVNRATVQYSVGVAVHEIGHVLGVTSDSLTYFRHPVTGFPLTQRPFSLTSVKCVSGEEMVYVGMPGPNIMREGIDKRTGSNYFEVITPTVTRIVKNHFNCPNATGARLENQPTSEDCFGSHWDERMFYTEIMGAVFSQTVNVLSPLTVALLEDSGWYRANYESEFVQISNFGHGSGCEFLDESCIDTQGNVPAAMEDQFCNQITSFGSSGSVNLDESGSQTCDPSHTAKTYCDLVDTSQVGGLGMIVQNPPSQFQYFEGRPTLRPYLFTSADYCPLPHLDPQSCIQFDGRPLSDEAIDAGEYYGMDSRCIETDGSRTFSLCLQTECTRLGMVQIFAVGEQWTCEYDGQVHTLLFQNDGDGPLRIKCPKAALVCPNVFCPANCAGRGDCIFRSRDTISSSEPLAKCSCDSQVDGSVGCFETALTFPVTYGYKANNPDGANKPLFLGIVFSLVASLAFIFIIVRQWKARQNLFM